jgi:hypothetical protein
VADEMRGGSDDPRARESATRGNPEEPPVSGPGGPEGQPSEEELRAQLEEEIKKVRVEDVVLQSVVSILNLSARRIAKDDERDLDQAKVGIDAARALVDLVKPDAQAQLRQAISELQVLYAKHAGEGPEKPAEAGEPPAGAKESRERDSGLWTPPGTEESG